jgi:hypothetical protein
VLERRIEGERGERPNGKRHEFIKQHMMQAAIPAM